MAWDVEGRRARVKAAAISEFAERGLAGARVDRIAAAADVNKERIYSYFGGKEALFAVVLAEQLAELAKAVPLEDRDRIDLAEYAGRVFDYHASHPHLLRLLHWEGLERPGRAVDIPARTAYYRSKVDVVTAAQARGELRADVSPAQLLYAIIAVAAWSFGVPQIAAMLTGEDPGTRLGRARQRKAIVALVRSMTAPDASA